MKNKMSYQTKVYADENNIVMSGGMAAEGTLAFCRAASNVIGSVKSIKRGITY